MNYDGIVLTGTTGSGRYKLATQLSALDNRFVYVKPATTKVKPENCSEDGYQHISETKFKELKTQDSFISHKQYLGHQYAILSEDTESVKNMGKTPILAVSPELADVLGGIRQIGDKDILHPQYLSVFLDAPDEDLEKCLHNCSEVDDKQLVQAQRIRDRGYRENFLYSIENRNVDSTADLIIALWNNFGRGGVLPSRLIRLMVDCGMLIEKAEIDNISGASYDLSLGDEYFYGGRIHRLNQFKPILMIEPYDYAIVTSHEIANFPTDICARFDLSVSLFCQGIILSNGPQVDPGFRGFLFCLLFNTSSSPVMLKRRQHYATMEFHKLLEPTYSYRGQYQEKDLLHYLPANATQGAINELKKELEQVRKESRNLQNITWAILSIILALIAVWVSMK